MAGRTILHLEPGFATIVHADRRIDTVAVGDPRIVRATPVRRNGEVFDVVLQAQTDHGTTNMVLWAGEATTVWDLRVGPGLRTADIVYVVTQPHAPAASPGTLPPSVTGTHNTARAAQAVAAPRPPAPAAAASRPPRDLPPTVAQAAATAPAPQAIELREAAGPVTAVFRAFRTASGILLRYAITNGGDTDLTMRATAILIRADGRTVAYGMQRDSVDRGRPDVIPKGATETGAIDIAVPAARRVELTLPLVRVSSPALNGNSAPAPQTAPAARPGTGPAEPLPIVLEATFSGLDRLPVAPAP
jgi:hypothetical protein